MNNSWILVQTEVSNTSVSLPWASSALSSKPTKTKSLHSFYRFFHFQKQVLQQSFLDRNRPAVFGNNGRRFRAIKNRSYFHPSKDTRRQPGIGLHLRGESFLLILVLSRLLQTYDRFCNVALTLDKMVHRLAEKVSPKSQLKFANFTVLFLSGALSRT